MQSYCQIRLSLGGRRATRASGHNLGRGSRDLEVVLPPNRFHRIIYASIHPSVSTHVSECATASSMIAGRTESEYWTCCSHPLQGPSLLGQPGNKLNFFFLGCSVAPPFPQHKVGVHVSKPIRKQNPRKLNPQWGGRVLVNFVLGERGGVTPPRKGRLSLLPGGSIFEHV